MAGQSDRGELPQSSGARRSETRFDLDGCDDCGNWAGRSAIGRATGPAICRPFAIAQQLAVDLLSRYDAWLVPSSSRRASLQRDAGQAEIRARAVLS
jgi:hypothetical protein